MEFDCKFFHDGQTPLHLAIIANSLDSVKTILSFAKVRTNIKDNVSR